MATEINEVLGLRDSAAAQPLTEATNAQLEEQQKVANYKLLCKTLRPAGIGSIVFGIVGIGMGFATMEDNPLNAGLAIIGFFLLVEGVWIAAAPSPPGLIVDGIALIILGLWNIGITLGGNGGAGMFLFLGIWQIVLGGKSFARYGRFSKLPMSKGA
jgi:hypothetical protein